MKKKFLMAAMTATIALGCTITSFAAEPVYFNDFESGAGDATIVGSGAIETVKDENFGKVFHNNVTGDTTVRSNYLVLPEDVLSHSAESKQLTIQFWVNKGTAENYFYSPIFSAYAQKNEQNTWPMFILQSRLVAQANCAGWTNYEAADCKLGLNEDGALIEDTSWLDDEEWHLYTAVLDDTSLKIYIDGEAVKYWESDGTDGHNQGGLFSNGVDLKYVCLGGNQAWDWADADAAYMFDDVAIYNVALSDSEIQAVIDETTSDKNPGEDETTTDKVDSPDTNNPDVEPTTPANPSEDSSKPSVEPTTPANPSEDPSNPSVEPPTTSDSVTSDFDVTDADAEKVNKEAVVTGLPENVTLRVASIEKSSTDYNAIAEFVNKELKGKKVAAADLSLVKNGVAYAEQPNGKVKVTLPLFENIKDAKWIQVYRYDNATKTFVEVDKVVEVKDGKFTFETDHFTPYLFASVNGPEEEPTTTAQPTTTGKTVTDTSNKPKTGDSAPIAVFAGMAAAGLAVFAVSKKRKNA